MTVSQPLLENIQWCHLYRCSSPSSETSTTKLTVATVLNFASSGQKFGKLTRWYNPEVTSTFNISKCGGTFTVWDFPCASLQWGEIFAITLWSQSHGYNSTYIEIGLCVQLTTSRLNLYTCQASLCSSFYVKCVILCFRQLHSLHYFPLMHRILL